MLDALIRSIPKAELHVHLEGTLEPELMLRLAARNAIDLSATSRDAARRDGRFGGLGQFLRLYYAAVDVLRTEQDFYDLATAYLCRARANGIRHVEAFFDPQSHLSRGVSMGAMVEGIGRAFDESAEEGGPSALLIMCFLRDLGPVEAAAVLRTALPYRDRIAGVGLDSSEAGHPPGAFAGVFAAAREVGLFGVAHAGEEGPAAYVREALDELRVRRIDHGVHAVDDPDLVERLRREQVPLTMCPLSNLRLRVVGSLASHPLKALLDAGVPVTVNSDDPAYFGGYLVDNYRAAVEALRLTASDVYRLARNSITASQLPDAQRFQLLAQIDAYSRPWLQAEAIAAG